ncbi:MAG: hypothetical protein QNJ61_00245, partial [Desulfobacterales bacterium]|nr:hypothetical protein [Desulfobacterales bacterium]
MEQSPATGTRQLMTRGDAVRFELKLPAAADGSAWLRTNLGQAATTREEIIQAVEQDQAPRAHDWYDLPMRRLDDRRFRI